MKLTRFACLFLICTPLAALASDPVELARSYLSHLENKRDEQARALMADDIAFSDPTWSADAKRQGPDAVIEAYAGNTPDVIYRETMAFESNGQVVIAYQVSGNFPIPNVEPVQMIHVMGELVRVLSVADGKVTSHMDLANYDRLWDAIKEKTGMDPRAASAASQ